MLEFFKEPKKIIQTGYKDIHVFENSDANIDHKTVGSFANEWKEFSIFEENEIVHIGDEYFDLIDKNMINKNSYVLDLGCGMGRWAYYISSKVKFVEAIDPGESVFSAAKMLKNKENVRISMAGADNIPFKDESFDFAFSLGVLHHIPDTKSALKNLVKKIKIDGYALIYLYYNLDNRGNFYRFIFYMSNLIRLIISRFPFKIKLFFCNLIATFIYLPLVGFSWLIKKTFNNAFYHKIPLSYYLNKPFKVMRNDALDRFGTPLEQRFSKIQIIEMMKEAGLDFIKVSPKAPYWHAIGKRIV